MRAWQGERDARRARMKIPSWRGGSAAALCPRPFALCPLLSALLGLFFLIPPRRRLRPRHDAGKVRILAAWQALRPFGRLRAPLGFLLALFLFRALARSFLLADFRFGHAVSDGSRSL